MGDWGGELGREDGRRVVVVVPAAVLGVERSLIGIGVWKIDGVGALGSRAMDGYVLLS